MSDEIVLLNVADGIAHVTLNRPHTHNAFDEAVIARLSAIWSDLAARDDVRAVVLTGKGKSFSAGGDLNWMKRAAAYSEEQNRKDATELAAMLNKLYTLPHVTIACVQGAAFGGGLGLISCCDIVIADADAVFALSEVKLGLIPATIGPYVLRAMGERHFRRYALSGERFTGKRAHEIGLIHEVAERTEDMHLILTAILKDIASGAPRARTAAKKLALDLAGKPITPDLIADTASRIAKIRSGSEAAEGVAAFFEKRKAGWVK